MNKISIILLQLLFVQISWSQKNLTLTELSNDFATINVQMKGMLQQCKNPLKIPRSIKNNELRLVDLYDWTSGFFAGNLWYTFEASQDTFFKTKAIEWTEALEPLQFYKDNHDLGFMVYCSYGNAYRLTGNLNYKKIIVQAAKSLCSRFNSKVGCIKSWNDFPSSDSINNYNFPVIVDNMMNLELLFFASKTTGDNYYRDIAISHANNTLANHFRKDGSSFHVVCYDSITGKVLAKETNQGFANNSAWARGQAWGLYGFTMCYRESKDVKYLQQAEKIANYIIKHPALPKDKIPLWDFNVNQKGYVPKFPYNAQAYNPIPRDASAAAIIASALLELSNYKTTNALKYKQVATQILHTLSGINYLAKPATNKNFILKHSVGSLPHKSEIDTPLVYADYYFLEALLRYQKTFNLKNKYSTK